MSWSGRHAPRRSPEYEKFVARVEHAPRFRQQDVLRLGLRRIALGEFGGLHLLAQVTRLRRGIADGIGRPKGRRLRPLPVVPEQHLARVLREIEDHRVGCGQAVLSQRS